MTYNQPNTKLLNGCTSILKEYSKTVHHDISLVPNDPSYYGLKCKDPQLISYNNHDYNVAIFRESDILGFNFALKFNISTISPKRSFYNLTDANLRIFHLNDSKSQLLFRAEFATNAMGQKHAQPHWQFEPYITKAIKENDYQTVLELREEEIEVLNLEADTLKALNISKVHFAMTSDWHKPKKDQIPSSYQVKISEESVVSWLDGCMNYIKSQITLL